jgi:hypothetical protein
MTHQAHGSQIRQEADHKRQPRRPIGPVPVERARTANVAQLQRAAGNRAVSRLIQIRFGIQHGRPTPM